MYNIRAFREGELVRDHLVEDKTQIPDVYKKLQTRYPRVCVFDNGLFVPIKSILKELSD